MPTSGQREMTKITLFGRVWRSNTLRPQSYDIVIAIAVAVGMAASHPLFS